MPVLDCGKLIDLRVDALRRYHQQAGVGRAEVDVSGGIDSAVVFALLVRALGADKVTACFLGINSSDAARDRALELARALGARLVVDDVTEEYQRRIATMLERLAAAGYSRSEIQQRIDADPTILGSIRSTMRAPIGRGYNRLTGGGIRHGTGNEDEDRFLRFFQKGGDGEVDTMPISFLAKGEVFQLGRGLGLPPSILAAEPSPDLWGVGEKKHTDEQEYRRSLGVAWDYSRIDPATGDYCKVGTIERMNRYLDASGEALFKPEVTVEHCLYGKGVLAAASAPQFAGMDPALVEQYLRSAKKAELVTRHKLNPDLPALGTRQELIAAGVLTNDLPVVST
ncbi:MAG: NAD(+) synthase [Deltaproteobacteria bacterium]|nr:NAD(+) synthase [Deltaproteobacteria bacterium]